MTKKKIDRVADITRIVLKLHDDKDPAGITEILDRLSDLISAYRGIRRDELIAIFVGLTRAASPRVLELLHREALKQEECNADCRADLARDDMNRIARLVAS